MLVMLLKLLDESKSENYKHSSEQIFDRFLSSCYKEVGQVEHVTVFTFRDNNRVNLLLIVQLSLLMLF